jgi:hypothetical protein
VNECLQRLGIELRVDKAGNYEVHGGDSDWLRAVLVAFGYHAYIAGETLHVPVGDRRRLERALVAALAPEAMLFDLDGVLACIGSRKPLAVVADVQAIAEHYPIAVVTTCPQGLAESVLERYGFMPFIRAVIGSEHRPCKPDPYPVRIALQQLGVQTAWMLGDNPSDVTAARGADVVPFAVMPRGIGAESHRDQLRAAGAVRLVAGVAAVRSILPRSGTGS